MVVCMVEPQGWCRSLHQYGMCWIWLHHSIPLSALVSLQGHLHDRYGQLVSIYTRLLLTKISFHVKVRPSVPSTPPEQGDVSHQQEVLAATDGFFLPFPKHPEFPPGLEVSDEVLEKTAGTDVNNM